MVKGRPRCTKLCCSSYSPLIGILYTTHHWGSKEIAFSLSVSPTHILNRLREMGVILRERGNRDKVKRPYLPTLSDQSLFLDDIKDVAEKIINKKRGD